MRELTGDIDGAGFRMGIPEGWNGRLVLWAKGWKATGSAGMEHNPNLDPPFGRDYLTENGYAWAASSFRPESFLPINEHSYVPYEAAEDLLPLREHFAKRIGAPDITYVGGLSMGGNVTITSYNQKVWKKRKATLHFP